MVGTCKVVISLRDLELMGRNFSKESLLHYNKNDNRHIAINEL